MEIVANGHGEVRIQNGNANLNIRNNAQNGHLQARHENGHIQLRNREEATPGKIDLSLNSWQKVLFPLILAVVHTIFRYLLVLVILCGRIQKKITSKWSYGKLRVVPNSFISKLIPNNSSIVESIRKHSLEVNEKRGFYELRDLADTKLQKKPTHIAFAILECNMLSLSDIGNLIAWCVALGIKNVTLYDLDGRLKEKKKSLNNELLQKLPITILELYTILWDTHSGPCISEGCDSFHKDSMNIETKAHKDTIKINLLSRQDGQGEFSLMTKSLAKKVKSRNLDVDAIDEQLIDINLNRNLRLSDPDLLVRFGLTSSNMGFLPWHIRLTEIHDIPTHLDIECWDIFQVLLRYSKCEQRFGR